MVKQVRSAEYLFKSFLKYIVDIIMFKITNIFGRISTSILDTQRNEVANLAKYVHLQELCTFQINISFTKY